MHGRVEMVFLDIGGVMYDDRVYAQAVRTAIRELGGSFSDREFAEEYAACKAAQAGSFRRRLAARFLGPAADVASVEARAARHWAYGSGTLEPDVLPCLSELAGRYRLGIIANQPSAVREAMVRDGLADYFAVWGVSDDVGLEKPDPRLFAHAVYAAAVSPARSVMVGDRLDYDVRPAQQVGMRAVWVLRGEAPEDPTPEQLAEPDACIATLSELPAVLEQL